MTTIARATLFPYPENQIFRNSAFGAGISTVTHPKLRRSTRHSEVGGRLQAFTLPAPSADPSSEASLSTERVYPSFALGDLIWSPQMAAAVDEEEEDEDADLEDEDDELDEDDEEDLEDEDDEDEDLDEDEEEDDALIDDEDDDDLDDEEEEEE